MLAGLAAIAAVVITDLAFGDRAVLFGMLVAGPLLASAGATPTQTGVVSCTALAVSFPIAAHDGLWGSGDQALRTVVLTIGCIAAVVSSLLRSRRDNELAIARPQARVAQRLRLALEAAEMGTWRWDTRSGHVEWDEQLERLFGLDPGSFDGTFDTYASLLHADDRERVLAAVRDGMAHDRPWHFDHRVSWRDGSVHWLEGRGEPVHDNGVIIGATGVTINVDARHALLAVETRARENAEQWSATVEQLADITTALAAASTVHDVGQVIVERVAVTLHAKSGYFAVADEDTNELVMRAQSGLPDSIVQKYARIDLGAPVAGTQAMRTGRSIFIESPDDRLRRFPDYPRDPAHEAFVVVPLPPIDGARAVLAFGFAESRRFGNDDRALIATVVDACAQALRRATAFEAEQSARDRLRILLDTSERLGALDEPERVIRAIVQLATRIGKWAGVVRIRPDGRLDHSVVAHGNAELAPLVRSLMIRLTDDGSVRRVIDTGEPILYHGTDAPALDTDDEPRTGYESCLLVPITIADRRIAVLTIGDDRPERLRAVDVELAVDLGRRGASALDRARLWQDSRQRLEAEHRIVELLQRTIVPDRLPSVPGVRLGAAYRPAEVDFDVGGDWYDAFVVADGSIVTAVGDVAGHGLQAASLMGRARNALRAYAAENPEPASILQRLQALLRAQDPMEMVTAFVAHFDPRTRVMSWSRAGHPPAVVASAAGIRWLDDVNGAPLGTAVHPYRTASFVLPPGALVVSYTDGLIERRDCIIDEGLAWLAGRVLEHVDDEVDTLCDKLVDDPFVPHPAPDDMCVLALRADNE